MKATCKGCGNSYHFDDSKIPEEGLTYKCPRCKGTVLFRKHSEQPRASFAPIGSSGSAGSGSNPIVNASYAGAMAGIGCAIPSVMMTVLGIGFLSLGMKISGYSFAGAVLMAFLRMLSAGVLIGVCLAVMGSRTEIDVWSIWGGLIGTAIGGAIGLISGLFAGIFMGGVLGIAVLFGAVILWIIKGALLTLVVILVRKYALSSEDDPSLSSPLSTPQMITVGVLFFLMVFTAAMEMKGNYSAKAAFDQAKQEAKSEGLSIENRETSLNDDGDLVVTGNLVNNSEDKKAGWIVIAKLKDYSGEVIRKEAVVSGGQMFTFKDMRIFQDRHENFPKQNPKSAIIKPGEAVTFHIVFPDPPEEYGDIDLNLKDATPKNMAEIMSGYLPPGLKGLRNMNE